MKSLVISTCLLLAPVGLHAARPVVFQTLDPVSPDETLLLFGADLSPSVTAEGLRLPDDPVAGPPPAMVGTPTGQSETMELLQATDLSAKVLIPAKWSPGVFAVRLRNADGAGEWRFANRPQLWWQMSGAGGKASPGGELRVFGKNFGQASRLWLVDGQERAREIPLKVARDFDVAADLPRDLPAGSYSIWLHNGKGGPAGFGESLPVEVVAPDLWPDTVFDVTQFGATHDNEHDDTGAIRRALKMAGTRGGGIVYLPRGTYIITGKLVIPPRTVLRGEARDRVWLKVPVYWPKPPEKLPGFDSVVAGDGHFGVESLSIVAQPVQRLIAAPDLPAAYGTGMARWRSSTPAADEVHLRNLRLQHLYYAHRVSDGDPRRKVSDGPSTIVIKGTGFSLEDSEVVSAGMPIQLQGAVRARISRNILRTGRNGWYGLFDPATGVFEENDISAADLEGSYGGVQGSVFEMMFRGNYWHDAFGDEREALTFDGPYYPAWMGRVRADGLTLTLGASEGEAHWPPDDNYPKNLMAVVAAGRGIGQAVPVATTSEKAITLTHPFVIAPDATSLLVIGARKSRVLITDNVVEDASVAFQLYSMAAEFVVAHNRCVRTGGSYAEAADFTVAGRRRYSYALFNQWLGNVFAEGLVYDQGGRTSGFVGYSSNRSEGLSESTPALGNRFEGNHLLAGTQLGVAGRGGGREANPAQPIAPLSRDAIFENNLVVDQPRGITLDPGHRFGLLRKNHFRDVATPIQDQATETVRLENDEQAGSPSAPSFHP